VASNITEGLEGTKGFERQTQAAKLFEEVYARSPDHPGVLHYLIHVYDDPAHGTGGTLDPVDVAENEYSMVHDIGC
jgi:hypothetical protein